MQRWRAKCVIDLHNPIISIEFRNFQVQTPPKIDSRGNRSENIGSFDGNWMGDRSYRHHTLQGYQATSAVAIINPIGT